MRRGKVQTTDDKVNVLVEHEDGNRRCYSSLNVPVLCEKMSDEEINEEFAKIELSIEDKKRILRKIKGFAISNVNSKEHGISSSDLFRYVENKSM